MKNKTCGECKWYDYHHLLCVVGGDVAPTDCACDNFIPIKLTNGDKINTENANIQEIWAKIPEYPNYFISTFGRIKSVDPRWRFPRILKQKSNGTGYMQVQLTVNGKHRTVYIHRLVADVFIPNSENKPHVDHIDTNRCNNYVGNLRWCTPKENRNFLTTAKRCAEAVSKSLVGKIGKNARRSKRIYCVETNKIYWGTLEAQRDTGVCSANISKVLHGKRKTAGGFHWLYCDNNVLHQEAKDE
jgi:hypothetical protein